MRKKIRLASAQTTGRWCLASFATLPLIVLTVGYSDASSQKGHSPSATRVLPPKQKPVNAQSQLKRDRIRLASGFSEPEPNPSLTPGPIPIPTVPPVSDLPTTTGGVPYFPVIGAQYGDVNVIAGVAFGGFVGGVEAPIGNGSVEADIYTNNTTGVTGGLAIDLGAINLEGGFVNPPGDDNHEYRFGATIEFWDIFGL